MAILVTRRETRLLLLAAIVAFVLYRPDRVLPLDFVDFSEFLPILKSRTSFASRIAGLVDYYMSQGRTNVVQYFFIDVKWTFFQAWTPGWQWPRYLVMLGVLALTYRLLLRLGCSSPAAAAGTAIYLVSPAAVAGWTRMTMGEPFASLLLLILSHLALDGSRGDAPRWRTAWLSVLMSLIIFTKEMLAASLLFPLVLTTLSGETGKISPSVSHDSWRFVRAASYAGVVALLPAAVVLWVAPESSYGALWANGVRGVDVTLAAWLAALLPVDVGRALPAPLAGLALLTFLAITLVGWRLRLIGPSIGRERILLGLSLGMPLTCALVYVPWPGYQSFYAIPFLVGSAMLAAMGLSAIESHLERMRILPYIMWGVMLAFAAAHASTEANRAAAVRRATLTLVRRLSAMPRLHDTVYVATEQRPLSFWQGLGPTFERYGEALGHEMPVLLNLPCEEARQRAASATAAVVFYSSMCQYSRTSDAIVVEYRRVAFPHVLPQNDTLRVDLLFPRAVP